VTDKDVVRGPVGQRTDAGRKSLAATTQASQTADYAQASPVPEPGQRLVLDAYDPLPAAVLLFVLTAVTHLLLHALGLDATLEVFSRFIGSVSRVIGSVG
jgi:hypothetical protein